MIFLWMPRSALDVWLLQIQERVCVSERERERIYE